VTRALAVALACAVGGCGDNVRSCKDGTVFLTITYDATSAGASAIDLTVTVDGKPMSGQRAHSPGATVDTIEIDFAAGYPAGATITVTVGATGSKGDAIGFGRAQATLDGSCQALTVDVTAASPDAGAPDQSIPADLSIASDQSIPADISIAPDLTATPDLTAPRDLTPSIDFTVARDMVSITDMTKQPDLVVIQDMTKAPDLVAVPDLSTVSDLTMAIPDLTMAPDLTPGCAQNGAFCNVANDCCSALCMNHTCGSCGSQGQPCCGGAMCANPFVCENGMCVQCLAVGSPCQFPAQCCNNNCAGGICM